MLFLVYNIVKVVVSYSYKVYLQFTWHTLCRFGSVVTSWLVPGWVTVL